MRLVPLIVLAMLAQSINAQAQEVTSVTGCLDKSNRLVKLAFGDQPATTCGNGEQQLSVQLSTAPQATKIKTVMHAITLSVGEAEKEEPIIEDGPNTIYMKCKVDAADTDPRHTIEIRGNSTIEGWTATPPLSSQQLDSGGSILFHHLNNQTQSFTLRASDGSYITIPALAFGWNISGSHCLVIGVYATS